MMRIHAAIAHVLHFQDHHQLMYFSNVIFQENAAEYSGAGFQIEDSMEPGHWCVNQLVVMENCHFIGNNIIEYGGWSGGGVAAHFPQIHSHSQCIPAV